MKIKKSPPKKLAPMPPEMKELIDTLSTSNDSDLANTRQPVERDEASTVVEEARTAKREPQ
ncbi:hypothetical protein K7432_015646, partial [Basidiobolus ranarum]